MLGGLVLDLVDHILDAVNVGREIFDVCVGNETARVDDHVMSGNGGGGGGRGRHGDRRARENPRAKRRKGQVDDLSFDRV